MQRSIRRIMLLIASPRDMGDFHDSERKVVEDPGSYGVGFANDGLDGFYVKDRPECIPKMALAGMVGFRVAATELCW
jgi:hypothetical protein